MCRIELEFSDLGNNTLSALDGHIVTDNVLYQEAVAIINMEISIHEPCESHKTDTVQPDMFMNLASGSDLQRIVVRSIKSPLKK